MKPLLALLLAAPVLVSSACRGAGKASPPPTFEAATPTAEHEWLQQLVGEWKVRSSSILGPDQPALEHESVERVRSIGGLWVLCEGSADVNGTPFTSVMTIGYDAAEKRFVGSWIDTVQTRMWTYEGELDAARNALVLEARGPAMHDPNATATYRDTLQVVDRDHKRLVSSIRNRDGSWTTFMTAEYVRTR